MNAATLTEKIHSASDSELKESLRKKFAEIRREFTDGCTKSIHVFGAYEQGTDNSDKKFHVDAHKALTALEGLSFEIQRDKARDDKLNGFMSQVERLTNEVDDLRQMIPQ